MFITWVNAQKEVYFGQNGHFKYILFQIKDFYK